MNRVVIYGEYPPTGGPAAEATLAAVRAHLAGGAEVVVMSPEPSAAHHHADLGTVSGVVRLARLAAGADLELALNPAVLADHGGRGTPAQALLALAVNRARHATVHLGTLGGPTGRGRVRLVLGRADLVTVASQADAEALERAGVERSRLSVRPSALARPDGSGAPDDGGEGRTAGGSGRPWNLSDAPEREELEAAVRRRSAEDREVAAANSAASTWPLQVLPPISPPPPSGRPPSPAIVKLVRRLSAGVVAPLAEHINRLQQATIESIDRNAALPEQRGDQPT